MATGWGTNELVRGRSAPNAYEAARSRSAAGLANTLSSRGIGVNAEGGLGQTTPGYMNAAYSSQLDNSSQLNSLSGQSNVAQSQAQTTPTIPAVPPGQVIPPGTPNKPGGPTTPPQGAAGAIANTMVNNGQTVMPAAPSTSSFVPVTSTINTDNGIYYSKTTPTGGNVVWNPNAGPEIYIPAGGYHITGTDPSTNAPVAGAPFGTDNYGNPFTSQAQADDWKMRDAARTAALSGFTFDDAYRNFDRLP